MGPLGSQPTRHGCTCPALLRARSLGAQQGAHPAHVPCPQAGHQVRIASWARPPHHCIKRCCHAPEHWANGSHLTRQANRTRQSQDKCAAWANERHHGRAAAPNQGPGWKNVVSRAVLRGCHDCPSRPLRHPTLLGPRVGPEYSPLKPETPHTTPPPTPSTLFSPQVCLPVHGGERSTCSIICPTNSHCAHIY